MRSPLVWIIVVLVVSILLVGCGGTSEVGLETASPTVTAAAVDVQGTSTATDVPSAIPDSTATQPVPTATQPVPTATPSLVLSPASTATPLPTATPESTPTTTPNGPGVIAFSVSPAAAWPGDTVTLSWEARGDRATLCPTAPYIFFTGDDCWQVPLSGTADFAIPLEAASFQFVDFVLTVETGVPAAAVTAQASVALKCATTWFFSEEPQAGICPVDPLHSYAAAQAFEQGMMIWLEDPGRYYLLQDTPLLEDDDRKRLDVISDPLDIERDTSSEIQPPSGLYAPVSGFGLVWRGDVAQSPGFREELGWALAPEFGYDAILQCDDARPSGGRSWQTCYLEGPEGEVILLHPLGGWELWVQP